MSTTSRAPAPSVAPGSVQARTVAPAPAAQAPGAPSPAQLVRRGLEGTPGKLRLAAALSVVVCLAFALVGGYAFLSWGAALDDAKADAAQLVRVQNIQTSMNAADAAASNGVLSGGIERPQAVQAYAKARSEAGTLLAQAAGANAADAKALEAVNDAIITYAGLVERARAENRSQLPVGTAYLRQARQVLTTQIVPALQNLAQANQQRVSDAYASANRASALFGGAVALGLVGLAGSQLWLARRTHRIVNVPLAVATVAVLVAGVAGWASLATTARRADTAASKPYAASVALAQARTAAYDAKSQESLRLINRGNGASYEKQYDLDVAAVRAALTQAEAAGATDSGRAEFDEWTKVHDKIKAADLGNTWSEARDLAVTSDPGGSNALFTAFGDASGAALTTQVDDFGAVLSTTRTLMVFMGWLSLALGVLAAVGAYAGVSQRLEEYR